MPTSSLSRRASRAVVARYSDHIALPILMKQPGTKEEKIEQAAALWMRPRTRSPSQAICEFYRFVKPQIRFAAPHIHWRAEGKIDYTAGPLRARSAAMDLFHPERKHRLKLYVRRVFITDDCADILPGYLRFLQVQKSSIRGSAPQHQPPKCCSTTRCWPRFGAALVKRSLAELAKMAEKEPEAYAGFWERFRRVLKEGLYEEQRAAREPVENWPRFRSTGRRWAGEPRRLLGRMKPGQDAIYYISGESVEAASKSPQIEGFAARGIEVLLLADPVDEFWIPAVGVYDSKTLKSVTRGGSDLEKIALPKTKRNRPMSRSPRAPMR